MALRTRPVPKLGPFEIAINQQLSVCVCGRAKGRARTNDEIMQAWSRQTGDRASSGRADEYVEGTGV